MAKKFFSYSFQVSRTKKTGTIFIIFVVVALIGTLIVYKINNNTTRVNNLTYKVAFGVNNFEDKNCDKAYRVNSHQKICGTICVKSFNKKVNYIEELKKNMETNGFDLSDTTTKRISGTNWNYFKTNNSGSVFNYYIADKDNKTYSVEFIDQTSYLTKNEKENCQNIYNNVLNSLKLN